MLSERGREGSARDYYYYYPNVTDIYGYGTFCKFFLSKNGVFYVVLNVLMEQCIGYCTHTNEVKIVKKIVPSYPLSKLTH